MNPKKTGIGSLSATERKNLCVVNHPLVQHKLTIMRDKNTPCCQFRTLLSEITTLMMYEVTREFALSTREIQTPMCDTRMPTLAAEKKPVIVSILRAGNGFLDGTLDTMPSARVGFIGLERDESGPGISIKQYYCKLPDHLDQRQTILVDPMLATGQSSSVAITNLRAAGAKDIRFMCLVAAPEGIARIREEYPNLPIITAAVDSHLDERSYIVPGLGDAGDRMFGTK